ncbi:Multidrug resistance protein D [Arsenophonus endosymbiont of Bemisia tabaci Q2]|nr:Multidrug resistance protein D [Arsenophonus endosymbiont of Bemisia tabaci Q2]
MRKLEHFNLLLMLIVLIAVGQMTQTIYVPVIAEIAAHFAEPDGAVQSVMGAYLLFYGFSQLFYGPIAKRFNFDYTILSANKISVSHPSGLFLHLACAHLCSIGLRSGEYS